jgi:DNA-binding XRE family transcriptional regulator
LDSTELSQIRHHLRKTQVQLSQLLGVSPKAVQSFEQGWRNVPIHVERQLLFLLYQNNSCRFKVQPCWEKRNCSLQTRENCPAWELKAGDVCWFINGTICEGRLTENWTQKMQTCRQCEVFRSIFTSLS